MDIYIHTHIYVYIFKILCVCVCVCVCVYFTDYIVAPPSLGSVDKKNRKDDY